MNHSNLGLFIKKVPVICQSFTISASQKLEVASQNDWLTGACPTLWL
jgi:hypothetical protein